MVDGSCGCAAHAPAQAHIYTPISKLMPTTHPPADLHPVMRLERFRPKPSVNLARAPAEESARGFRIEWPSSGHRRMQSASTRP
ncbi:hypothetical protein AOLI_G00292700 [Acnodon oligacanthus]